MIKLYNLDNIESIIIHEKLHNDWYTYREPIIKKGKIKEPEYFRHIVTSYSREEILEDGNYYIENNKVYYKPHVIIKFISNNETVRYFDTINDMDEYLSELYKKLKYKLEKL
jgi:hypothetical protein